MLGSEPVADDERSTARGVADVCGHGSVRRDRSRCIATTVDHDRDEALISAGWHHPLHRHAVGSRRCEGEVMSDREPSGESLVGDASAPQGLAAA
jgi:hypothetical protein